MSRTLEEAAREASTCTKCRLSHGRTQVVYADGSPTADLMFIGEAPGFHEDKQGLPFVGAAGQLLNRLLSDIGLAREDVRIVNVVMCRPPGNRDPLPDEIESCTPWLLEQIDLVDPKVIVTLGNFATRFVLEKPAAISRVRGERHVWKGRTVIPTYHPAAVLHGGGDASPTMKGLQADFASIKEALGEPRPVSAEQPGLF
ncbi:MAG: uracil-DNA glycosylase [Actinomycetota bacterium]